MAAKSLVVIENLQVLAGGRVDAPTAPAVIRHHDGEQYISVVLVVGKPTSPETRDVDIPALLKRWREAG